MFAMPSIEVTRQSRNAARATYPDCGSCTELLPARHMARAKNRGGCKNGTALWQQQPIPLQVGHGSPQPFREYLER
jgi:hypothetical protein